jgi:hypothetical protein
MQAPRVSLSRVKLSRLQKLDASILKELRLNGTIPANIGDVTNLSQSALSQVAAIASVLLTILSFLACL